VSQQDINLDVGGRTAEIVSDILRKNEISVLKSETGGFSGSTLELNTRLWQAAIHPLLRPGGDQCRQEKMPPPTSEEIDLMVEETKPIPQIALKIIRLLKDGDYNLKDLSEELKSDQVLSAKSIRLCNSVMMGAKKRIDTIDQAILLMGGINLLKIVVSAAVESFFLQKDGGYSLMRGGLFKHALGVANAAKVISSFTRRSDPDKAYTAGLLHDIGKVVLDQYFLRSFSLFYQNTPVDSDDFVTLEKQALNIDHLEVGKRLAMKWQLPENLAEVIEFHHYPEKAVIDKDLVHIVYLADLLSSWFMAGLERERINTESLSSRLAQIGLSGGQLPRIIDLVPWQKIMEA
jgi:putative nucleotidyltransferase with HDIG domain